MKQWVMTKNVAINWTTLNIGKFMDYMHLDRINSQCPALSVLMRGYSIGRHKRASNSIEAIRLLGHPVLTKTQRDIDLSLNRW